MKLPINSLFKTFSILPTHIHTNIRRNQIKISSLINCMHMFICGSRSFGHQHKNGRSTSKRSKSFSNFSSTKINPYADRGLDKFYSLVADLEHKKQQIYQEMAPEDISIIRFIYSDIDEQMKPVIVRAKNSKTKILPLETKGDKSSEIVHVVKPLQVRRNVSFKSNTMTFYCYICVMMMLILVLLAFCGRSMAILCTSIAWYLVPQFIGIRVRIV